MRGTPRNKDSVVSLLYVKHRHPLKLVVVKKAANIIKHLVPLYQVLYQKKKMVWYRVFNVIMLFCKTLVLLEVGYG